MFKFKPALPQISLLLFSFLNWHCTKIDTTTIGDSLIPAVDNVNTFADTLSVIANNIDSIPFGKDCATIYPAEDHALGIIKNDPLFGSTQATIYTELKPDVFPFTWPATAAGMTLDSVVLVLSYRGTYGDTTQQQRVEVHELTNANLFAPDSSSCSSYSVISTALGSTIYTPQRLKDSVKVRGDTSSNQLRIRLSNTFGQRLLSQDSAHAFKSDSLFKNFFRGFAIIPDLAFGGNAITYYGLTDVNTKLAVYFKFTNSSLVKTDTAYYFRFGGFSASANNILRSHIGSEIGNYVSTVQRPLGDTVVYIQATPGTYAELKIPALSTLSNRIIHRAELTMDQVYSPPSAPDQYLVPPSFLYIDMRDSVGAYYFYHTVPCDLVAPSGSPDLTTFGGGKTTVKDAFGHDIARYTFNLTRYVQKIVTNHRKNTTLRLRAPDYITTPLGYTDDCGLFVPTLNYPLNDPALGRVKLGGGNSTNYRMKLRIIYSKI